MKGPVADNMRFVGNARLTGVARSPACPDSGAGRDTSLEEGGQADGRHFDRHQVAATRHPAMELFRGGLLQFTLTAPSSAAGRRIVLGSVGDLRLVYFDQVGQQKLLGINQRPAQLGGQQPAALAGGQPLLPLQMTGRDAVRMCRHRIGRSEPHRQRQLGAVQDRAGGHRGLLVAGQPLVSVGLRCLQAASQAFAGRAGEAIRPRQRRQINRACGVIGKTGAETQARSRESRPSRHLNWICVPSMFCHVMAF